MRLEKIPARSSPLHRGPLHDDPASGRSPGSGRRSLTWRQTSPTTCSGWRTKPGTSARGRARRATLDDLHTLSRLLGEQDSCLKRLAAAHAGPARRAARGRPRRAVGSCIRPTRARVIASPGPRASRPPSPRSSNRTSARRRPALVVVDSLCGSGWPGGRSRKGTREPREKDRGRATLSLPRTLAPTHRRTFGRTVAPRTVAPSHPDRWLFVQRKHHQHVAARRRLHVRYSCDR